MGVCNRVQRPRWYKLCYYLTVEPQFPSTCFWCNGKELVEHVAWIVLRFQILQAFIVCTKHIFGSFFVFCSTLVSESAYVRATGRTHGRNCHTPL
jgi:hypothetical protein